MLYDPRLKLDSDRFTSSDTTTITTLKLLRLMIGVKSRKNLDNFAWKQDLSWSPLGRRDGITRKFEHSKVDEDLRLGPCRGTNEAGDWTLMEDQKLERLYSGKSNKEWLCQIKDKGKELSPIPTFKMMRWKGESADAED
ncbi:hypothetical protein BY996DRAFT_6439516 [Phakopsora pachyrhizi]|nr:hypothetical protein BY996DRAFT_6439516 [Phakopsora pachyrhizi]